jgi:hypothetical protein
LRGFKSSKIYNGGQQFPYDIEKEKDHLPDQYDWRLFGAVTPVKVIKSISLFRRLITALSDEQ